MTEARARELDPAVTTGLGLSATEVFGDCRPLPPPEMEQACGAPNPACARERAPLRVLVVPVNRSIARSDACPSGVEVSALLPHAVADRRASAGGELVLALPPGRYLAYLSRDDRCAACGAEADGAGCLIDVEAEAVTTRDLVLDRSTR